MPDAVLEPVTTLQEAAHRLSKSEDFLAYRALVEDRLLQVERALVAVREDTPIDHIRFLSGKRQGLRIALGVPDRMSSDAEPRRVVQDDAAPNQDAPQEAHA